MPKKLLITLAVLAAGLGTGVLIAGIPALKRYVRMERM
jgi:hypothetical protein